MELTQTQKDLLAKIDQIGECQVEDADDSNVPVNIFITDEEDGQCRCYADNFTPRRGSINQTAFNFSAPDKQTCQAVVREFWLPLYKIAVQKLEATGELYYWELD